MKLIKGDMHLNFKRQYTLRNTTLSFLYWFMSLSFLVIAYSTIKYVKVIYYGNWMFENVNPFSMQSINWLLDNYFTIGGYSVFTVLFLSLIADIFLRRVYVRI